MERLIVCRHAESVFNVRGVLNGDPSVPGGLTPAGRDQADRLGELLASEPIDLCVTTAFERTVETAALALSGRTVRQLVVPELDDPPNGVFELRPYGELASWRDRHGPDEEIPGTGRSERAWVEGIRAGLGIVAARPEPTILAILHGWFVEWVAASCGRSETVCHAVPLILSIDEVREALRATSVDVFARYPANDSAHDPDDAPR